MSHSSLPLYKKLTLTFRLEPGCLGPDGIDHIEGFCVYAKAALSTLDSNFLRCVIVPRYDKSLAETEYKTNNKLLDFAKAEMYLKAFGKDLDEFEEQLQDRLSVMIDEYLGRESLS